MKDEIQKLLGNDLVDKLKATILKFSAVPAPTPVSVVVKLEDITLQDGTVLTVDKKEIGGLATITTADGSNPAPDGDYIDADGNTYTVVSGVITEIATKAAEKTEGETPAVPAEQTMSAITELKALVAKLEKQSSEKITGLKKENSELKNDLAEQKKGLALALSCLDKIAEQPVALSLEKQTKKSLPDIPYEKMTNYQKLKYNEANQ